MCLIYSNNYTFIIRLIIASCSLPTATAATVIASLSSDQRQKAATTTVAIASLSLDRYRLENRELSE